MHDFAALSKAAGEEMLLKSPTAKKSQIRQAGHDF